MTVMEEEGAKDGLKMGGEEGPEGEGIRVAE